MNIKYSVNSDLETKLPVNKPKKPAFKKLRFSTQFMKASPGYGEGIKVIHENIFDDFSATPHTRNRNFCDSSTCRVIKKCLDSKDWNSNISQCIKRLFSK